MDFLESEPFTAVQARAVAAVLLEAGDELDSLDGPHPLDSSIRRCCGGVGTHTQD